MNQPRPITPEEWDELAGSDVVQGFWPPDEDEGGADLADQIYGVRFDYLTDGPGYDGSLYLLLGGAGPETRPIGLIRDQVGRLKLVNYSDAD
jgi:hypothetical protein